MLTLVPMTPDHFDLDGVSALAVTSKRVASLIEGHAQLSRLRSLKVFAVGEKTAEVMRALGFTNVCSANGDVEDLSNLVRATPLTGRLLYLAARDRAGDLEGTLERSGVSVTVSEIYAMEPVRQIAPEACARLIAKDVDAVLIYSRRTAEAFVDAVRGAGRMDLFDGLRVVAISQQSAEPIPAAARLEIAPRPNEDELLRQVLTPC